MKHYFSKQRSNLCSLVGPSVKGDIERMVNNSEKFKDDHNKQNRISSKNILESYFFKKLILDNCDEAIKSAKAACPEPKVVNPLGLNPPSMRLTK